MKNGKKWIFVSSFMQEETVSTCFKVPFGSVQNVLANYYSVLKEVNWFWEIFGCKKSWINWSRYETKQISIELNSQSNWHIVISLSGAVPQWPPLLYRCMYTNGSAVDIYLKFWKSGNLKYVRVTCGQEWLDKEHWKISWLFSWRGERVSFWRWFVNLKVHLWKFIEGRKC